MSALIKMERQEYKYALGLADALSLQKKLEKALRPDAYTAAGGCYRVKSLYFDSIRNQDFAEKEGGYEVRKKIRLRIYDEDEKTAKLELKAKRGMHQHKTSLLIKKEDAIAVSSGDYGVLLQYEEEKAYEIYSLMMLGAYRPAVVVEYDRRAYTYPEYDTRITLDSDVKSTEINLDLYDRHLNYHQVIADYVILEVKYSGQLAGFIKSILSGYGLNQISSSKYCQGRSLLAHYI